ncbi:hypothetical protein [Pseudomonas syringae]|nr:hypothetical protein [Pseudomonas syringae]
MPTEKYGGVSTDAMIRYITHLPENGDVQLTLLKTHLLVEELLTYIIERKCIRPNYLKKAKLNFAQKIHMAHAMSEINDSSWVWGALQKLNTARNSLSHKLDHAVLDKEIADFVLFIDTQTEPIEERFMSEHFSKLYYASFYLYSELSAHADFDPAKLAPLMVNTILTGTPRKG